MALLDPDFWILLLRLAFLALVYLFLVQVVFALRRDLRRGSPLDSSPRQALARLIVVESPDPALAVGKLIDLDAHVSIGRGTHNTIVVNDGFASANHATLALRDKRWYIADGGSTNGTFLNRKKIVETTAVEFGDIIETGRVKFKLVR